ncbi:anthranilate phosphoribosyltransferase [Thermosulfurimonas marina]|uniref:Anthranilate phosphoribosyltransferase n=1 Tax=Thermosulfurimonas marina TaxID=2047767 RepID=A0A6H1WT90_9BACT|nr:anthranilate phosphoribosyltransferase [Thermosulfurimonas marina]QJA06369.1 anthranilate phosphoribosyltransferase [Thermosulfurimonas marina]
MEDLRAYLRRLVEGRELSEEEAARVVGFIMEGRATPAQIGALLAAWRMRGETWREIAGAARALREHMVRVEHGLSGPVVDTCGTGGDAKGTFNVSTAAALVVAAAGVPVAKHGNRSVTSRSGSADVIEALGIPLEVPPEVSARALREVGFCFLFAPAYHPAMKEVAGPRRELGFRTIFNLLGPLANPALADTQVLGVFDFRLTEKMAYALDALGARRALVVFGEGGYDEFTVTGSTKVSELREGRITTYYVDPQDVGLEFCEDPGELLGGDAQENARLLENLLSGKETGPKRDMVLLNAGAALYAAEKTLDLRGGVALAREVLESGAARQKLEEIRRFFQTVCQ